MATVVARNGQQFTVPDDVEGDYIAQGLTVPGAVVAAPVDYTGMKVDALRRLVADRNEGRADEALIVVDAKAKKGDLVDALEADDARAAAVVEAPAEHSPDGE